MRRGVVAALLTFMSTTALASEDPQVDVRALSAAALCGATNTTCKTAYANGSKDGTAAVIRVKTAYLPMWDEPRVQLKLSQDRVADLAAKLNTELTRVGILQNDLGKVTRERDDALTALAACKVAPGCYTPPAPPPPPPPPPSPPPAPTPAPTPAPAPPPATVPIAGLPMVDDGIPEATLLQPAWGTGAIPPSAVPDVVGAFRLICHATHESYDDPIVYPGQPGKSHLHQYFGNDGADANSTYESLRKTGKSTCGNEGNRSAYWMPAMMNGRGQIVRPDYVSIYYKRRPKTDPLCAKIGVACVDLPRGLKFIFGYDMLNMGAKATGGGYFNCDGSGMKPTDPNKAKVVPGHYPDIPTAAKNCPLGARLGAVISAPECWDGKNLDSADHRSHVAYSAYIGQSYAQCPATHPYVIPTFTLGAWYQVDDTLDHSGTWNGLFDSWHLSSDNMPGMPMKPGTTFHTDWFGAWKDSIMQKWIDNCINRLLNCSGGDLGNGQQLKQPPDSWVADPHLVSPPPAP